MIDAAPPLGAPHPSAARSRNDAIAKAIAIDPARRYGDVLEFAFEVENGANSVRPDMSNKRSLYERNPLLFWQAICALLALALALVLARRTIG
ncbi:hypothetical protein, partial [uncultured Thiodictyon sp.]|uniref:hypothetical protein n=1 Tax=uncultured Thiodictyon sp. TaxID=1846217 RepID=UPI0025EAB4D5